MEELFKTNHLGSILNHNLNLFSCYHTFTHHTLSSLIHLHTVVIDMCCKCCMQFLSPFFYFATFSLKLVKTSFSKHCCRCIPKSACMNIDYIDRIFFVWNASHHGNSIQHKINVAFLCSNINYFYSN